MYLVEQPELHLHPRAQSFLGDFFVDLRKNGVQSIIETHSEHLILRLLQHVASGKLSADDVSIYYIYPRGRRKVVKRIRIDERASFINKWPQGFFPETLAEARSLAALRAKHR
jgi:predicted ATPase